MLLCYAMLLPVPFKVPRWRRPWETLFVTCKDCFTMRSPTRRPVRRSQVSAKKTCIGLVKTSGLCGHTSMVPCHLKDSSPCDAIVRKVPPCRHALRQLALFWPRRCTHSVCVAKSISSNYRTRTRNSSSTLDCPLWRKLSSAILTGQNFIPAYLISTLASTTYDRSCGS